MCYYFSYKFIIQMISYNHILAHERYLVVTMQWAFCETWESNASGPPCCEACGGRYHLEMESMAPSWLGFILSVICIHMTQCNEETLDAMRWIHMTQARSLDFQLGQELVKYEMNPQFITQRCVFIWWKGSLDLHN